MIDEWRCNFGDAQKWYYDYSDGTIRLAVNTNMCVDDEWSSGLSSLIHLWSCNGNPGSEVELGCGQRHVYQRNTRAVGGTAMSR